MAPRSSPSARRKRSRAALVRFHRARLPAPEDVFDGGEPERSGRKERRERKDATPRTCPRPRAWCGSA
jgi:hypothetical protein